MPRRGEYQEQETEQPQRAHCAKHGEHDMVTYYVGKMPYPYCPYCYGEHLVAIAPVRS